MRHATFLFTQPLRVYDLVDKTPLLIIVSLPCTTLKKFLYDLLFLLEIASFTNNYKEMKSNIKINVNLSKKK